MYQKKIAFLTILSLFSKQWSENKNYVYFWMPFVELKEESGCRRENKLS